MSFLTEQIKICRRMLRAVLILAMVFSLAACAATENTNNTANIIDNGAEPAAVPSFTYNAYSVSLADNWNPHTWKTEEDYKIISYITSPLVTTSIRDSQNGVYQWVYEMAESVIDVTADHRDDLSKYHAVLPEGRTAEEINSGFVYEIRLNAKARWANGEPITADDYIYSMKALLDPGMQNSRAESYCIGPTALAGADEYHNAGTPIYTCMVYTDDGYDFDYEKGIEDGVVYINVDASDYELFASSLAALNDKNGMHFNTEIEALRNSANVYGYTRITEDNREAAETLVKGLLRDMFGINDAAAQAEFMKEALFVFEGSAEDADYEETVGCYKVDDYTINYVCRSQVDINHFLAFLGSNWLVYRDHYEKGMDTSEELATTSYGTDAANTMAYGPYMIQSYAAGRQMILVQNPNWYGWEKGEDGTLVSRTTFEVDGSNVPQYRTTRIVINAMDEDAAKQAFLSGELSSWTPSEEDIVSYTTSEQLYKADETYMMSLFFNTDREALKTMDESKGNRNSIVLSNTNFRKAFSLSIDRSEWVTATEGYKPYCTLLNDLYYYDIYNDPASCYRNSDQAMKAVVDLYGLEYGEGCEYKTLKDAYGSVTGYDLAEAGLLMKKACEELTAEGLYRSGDPVHIRVAYSKDPISSSEEKQMDLINRFINAAAEGSGFGTITLEAVGDIEKRYYAVPKGEFAVGYGAWGGDAVHSFRGMQVYCDPDMYDINEAANWDPTTETLIINIDGEDVTMTWQEWSGSCVGTGRYADADFDTKLTILAAMEEEYLKKYFRIPLGSSTSCEMLSDRHSYYTDRYNSMYGFGGFRLLDYRYNDEEWEAHIQN